MWRKLLDAWSRRSYEKLIRRYEQLGIMQQQDEWRKMASHGVTIVPKRFS